MSRPCLEVITRPSSGILPPRAIAVLQGSAVLGARGASKSAIKHLGQEPSHKSQLYDFTPAFKPRLSPPWCVHGSGRPGGLEGRGARCGDEFGPNSMPVVGPDIPAPAAHWRHSFKRCAVLFGKLAFLVAPKAHSLRADFQGGSDSRGAACFLNCCFNRFHALHSTFVEVQISTPVFASRSTNV